MAEMNLDSLSRAELERYYTLWSEYKRRHPIEPHVDNLPQCLAAETEVKIMFYGGSAGGGKGLALDTPLPTPMGWTTMGDIQEGDQLFDQNGEICNVLAVSEISHRKCFRLKFSDGSEIVADDVHRWVTFTDKERRALLKRTDEYRAKRRASRPSRAKGNKSAAFLEARAKTNTKIGEDKRQGAPRGNIRNTQEIFDTLFIRGDRANHAIMVSSALQMPDVDLPIAPYTLGAWLGDGTSSSGGITGIDQDIFTRIAADGYTVRRMPSQPNSYTILGIRPTLRQMGVLSNKHIPAAYFRASEGQRLELLQGLLDTDGCCGKDGTVNFDNINEQLIDGVMELVASLGIRATKTEGIAKLNGRYISRRWRVAFTTSKRVFHLERKARRLIAADGMFTKWRYIIGCEEIESVPTKCISVDSPTRQFLAGRQMIATHNSYLAIYKAMCKHRRSVIFRRSYDEGREIREILHKLVTGSGGTSKNDMCDFITHDGRIIHFRSLQHEEKLRSGQGKAYDLMVFDECTEFPESWVTYLMTWNRRGFGVPASQHCMVLMTGNPPRSSDGAWIKLAFPNWINKRHPRPAKSGEILWFVYDGTGLKQVEGAGKYPIESRDKHGKTVVTYQSAHSRCFIRASSKDNPYLGEAYENDLQALRSDPILYQTMVEGDFDAMDIDGIFQRFPSEWIDLAVERGKTMREGLPICAIGADVATSADESALALFDGDRITKTISVKGSETPNGSTYVAWLKGTMEIEGIANKPMIMIDPIGVGSDPYNRVIEDEYFEGNVVGVNFANATDVATENNVLDLPNVKSLCYWYFRSRLNPYSENPIGLPDDAKLIAQLKAINYRLAGRKMYIEDKEEMRKRVGFSPDIAEACIYAVSYELFGR